MRFFFLFSPSYLVVDSRQKKVFVVENIFHPKPLKQLLFALLMEDFGVATVSFGSSHLLSLLVVRDLTSLALPSGIVIDAGFWETSVLPIYDGRPLLTSARFLPLAGATLDLRLRELLTEHGTVISQAGDSTRLADTPKDAASLLTFDLLETLKVKIGSVNPSTEARQGRDETLLTASLPGDKTLTFPQWIGQELGEALFQKDEEDDRSIPVALAETLLWVNSDLRTPLASSILVSGGTAMLPGFGPRLLASTKALILAEPRYSTLQPLVDRLRLVETPFKPNLLAWTGGSALGALKVHSQEVTRDQYLSSQTKIAPDWTSREN